MVSPPPPRLDVWRRSNGTRVALKLRMERKVNRNISTPNTATAPAEPLRTNPRRARLGTLLGSITASLVMTLMVAGAAVAIEESSNAACMAADSTPCATAPPEWCESVNGEMLCPGEPT